MKEENKKKMGSPKIRLIAGLGNPGDEYENTYHNIGVLTLEYLIRKSLLDTKKMKPIRNSFEYIKAGAVAWVRSLKYMNKSGKAIAAAARFFDVKPEEIMILHDDSDLHIGEVKFTFDRGSAGHRGVQSIIDQFGTKKFFRTRIGIRPERKNQERRKKASELVLGNIAPEDRKKLIAVFKNIQNELMRVIGVIGT